MVHINNHFSDSVHDDGVPLVNFLKRHKWAEVIHAALRHQAKPYAGLAEDSALMQYITNQLQTHVSTVEKYWWHRSEELQRAEVSSCSLLVVDSCSQRPGPNRLNTRTSDKG